MGSAALAEAARSIREWSLNEGRASTSPSKTAEAFGSLVFTDKEQKARLPKPAYHALRATIARGEPLDVSTGRVPVDPGVVDSDLRRERHSLAA